MSSEKYNIFKPRTWAISKVIKDIINYRDWIKTIKKEKNNPNSVYNKMNMGHNYFYTIYFPLVLPQEDKELPDNIKKLRVIESLTPIHRYFDDELGFAEYIVPEFNQFYDEYDNPTLAYGIVYRFAFKRLSLGWVLSRLTFLVLLILGILNYSRIVDWLTNLI